MMIMMMMDDDDDYDDDGWRWMMMDDDDDDDDDIWNAEVSRRSIIKHIKIARFVRGLIYNGGLDDPQTKKKTSGYNVNCFNKHK
jgi:hypothetical protein